MKNVPNLIFYLQEFSSNLAPFLTIYFQLFSSGSDFYFRKTLTCGAQRSVAVSPRAAPWLVAVGGVVQTCMCGIKSAPDRPLLTTVRRPTVARTTSPHALPSRPHRLLCPRHAIQCLGRLAAVPTVSAQSRRHLRSVSHAAVLSDADHAPRAPAPPPRSEALPGVKPPRCLRLPPCPHPDSRVHHFLPAPPLASPSLPSQPRCR
jgi:hypothetical protein